MTLSERAEREELENALGNNQISKLLICFERRSSSIPFDPPDLALNLAPDYVAEMDLENLSSGILAYGPRSDAPLCRPACKLESNESVDVVGERGIVELVRGVGRVKRSNLGSHAARSGANPKCVAVMDWVRLDENPVPINASCVVRICMSQFCSGLLQWLKWRLVVLATLAHGLECTA